MVRHNILQKETTKTDLMLAFILVSGLVCLNTFIHQNSFRDCYGDFYFLETFVIIALCTWFYFWLLKDYLVNCPLYNSTYTCVIGTAVSGILMLVAVLFEVSTDWFSIFGHEEIKVGCLYLSKKYIYDIWAIVGFPVNVEAVFRAMKKEHFKSSSIFNSCIVIAGITVEGILIFRPLSNIWLIDLAILNIVTLAIAIWKYVLPDTKINRGNAIASVLSYAVFRVCLLPLQCNNWEAGITSVLYSGDWAEVKAVYSEIFTNASFWGTSGYLKGSTFLQAWLENWNRPVLQLLYYGGWIAVFGLLLMILFLILILVKILGVKNGRIHKNWIIYATAVAMLTDRAILGTLYGFGVPVPVALPFFGNTGMDAMAFSLILFGVYENFIIQRNQTIVDSLVSPETLFGNIESYDLLNKDNEPYDKEDMFEEVTVHGGSREIVCSIKMFVINERTFCVFDPRNEYKKERRFILELVDTRWITPDNIDNEILEEIMSRYAAYYAPDCIESEVELTNEKYDN